MPPSKIVIDGIDPGMEGLAKVVLARLLFIQEQLAGQIPTPPRASSSTI
jgi:hypothetical protein